MNPESKPTLETAGVICDTTVLRAETSEQVSDVREVLSKTHASYEPLDYIYVENSSGKLEGIVSLHQLLTYPDQTVLESIMNSNVVTVPDTADQEEVALIALGHELKSVPVVDSEDRLVGAVPSHRILRILNDEHVEDLLKEAGLVQGGLSSHTNAMQQIRGRLPWLLYGTLGGLLAAGVVQRFEGALAEQLLLAAFIPTIVYLADAVGNQVQTLYVRAYAFGLTQKLGMTIMRELSIALVIGLTISIGLSAVAYLWFSDALLGMILLGSALVSILFASVVAVIMPWLFIRIGSDPAVSSGPLGTIILDVSSIIIYFMVAEFILATFGA